MSDKGIYLNDSIHGLIPLTAYEKKIISTVGFNRLHDVYQNSTVYLTFPTNRTKRFEHSVGTMKLCSDMFYHAIENSSKEVLEEFYEEIKKVCGEIEHEILSNTEILESKLCGRQADIEHLFKEAPEGLKLSLIPRNVPAGYEIIHFLIIQSIRVAALLHDIGHPPFSHIVENALKSVLDECRNKEINNKGKVKDEFINIMSGKTGLGIKEKPLHEQMGDEISHSIMYEVIKNGANGRYTDNLFELFIMYIVDRIFQEKGYCGHLHRIVDSSLDGDRLDYVTRDPINSGMTFGKVDYNRIIDDMKLIIKPEPPDDTRKPFFCVPMKSVNAVEDFLRRRHAVYKNIIYHHRVIKTDCLLEYAVKELVKIHLDSESTSNNQIAEKNIEPNVVFSVQGLWAPMKAVTTYERSNALSGWDDSWLITVLKHVFYNEYYNKGELVPINVSQPHKYILSRRLAELLLHKKAYYSLIKRSEDFKFIDDNVKDVLKSEKNKILRKLDGINKLSDTAKTKIPTKGILGTMYDLFNNKLLDGKTLVLSYIDKHNSAGDFIDLENVIREGVNQAVCIPYLNDRIHDNIVVFRRLKPGLGMPVYFYRRDENICTLNDISGIKESLENEASYYPFFYVYLLIDNGLDQSVRINILRDIGSNIGRRIAEEMLSYKLKK